MTRSAGRGPNDPGRRDRIVQACLRVIASDGVDGTTARKVAHAAGVPLGSVTYYFEGRTSLLAEAFTAFAQEHADVFVARMNQVEPGDQDSAICAVVDLAVERAVSNQRDLVLALELYTLAARDPEFRAITHVWMRQSRQALERCFPFATAWMIDALIEGVSLHRALRADEPDETLLRRLTERTVRGILAAQPE